MKIALLCHSPLVQSSLGFFLENYLSSEEECDFIITDDETRKSHKPICLVSDEAHSHIHKPFTQQSLQEDLQSFYEKLLYTQLHHKPESTPSESSLNAALESAIAADLAQMTPFEPSLTPPSYPKDTSSELEAQIHALTQQSAKDLASKIIELIKSHKG